MVRCVQPAALLIAAFAVLSASPIGAEDPDSKRELVREVIDLAGGGDMAQQISTAMLSSMRASYSQMVEQLIASQTDLTGAQEQMARQQLANFDRFATKFYSRFSEAVDFDQLLSEIYVPLYMKHFTEQELHDLLKFQKSAIGRKSASVMPQLLQEAMSAMFPRLQPVLMAITAEVLAEEQAIILGQSP